MTQKEGTYADAGVNTEAGDDFSAMAGEVCRRSFNNSPFVEVEELTEGNFRGPRVFQIVYMGQHPRLDMAPDGIGTKVVLIDAANARADAARDLVAMTSGDIVRYGGKPLVFTNVLDVETLGEQGDAVNDAYRTLIEGLGKVAAEQQFVCFRGETAELSACVGSENSGALTKFNWAGGMLGAYLPDRYIIGDTLKAGQVVVALREYGFRSNGLSAVRKAFVRKFGAHWWENPKAQGPIEQAARPSTIYDRFLTEMNGWTFPLTEPRFKMHLIVHVTGGGIVDKFGQDVLFKHGFTAKLEDLFEPPEIMHRVKEWYNMRDQGCYRTFNCGNGALVVLDAVDVDTFVACAEEYGIEAQTCGFIMGSKRPRLEIRSGFTGKTLQFRPT